MFKLVNKIIVVILGKAFDININGTGAIQVQYIDRFKRVFKSEENARVLQEKVDVNTLPDVYREIFKVSETTRQSTSLIEKINDLYKEYRGYAFIFLPVILYVVAELGVVIRGD